MDKKAGRQVITMDSPERETEKAAQHNAEGTPAKKHPEQNMEIAYDPDSQRWLNVLEKNSYPALPEVMAKFRRNIRQSDRKKLEKEKAAGIFDPETEVLEILARPKEERAELLREFKEKMAEQKEGLARMRAELIRKIRENPDIPLSELFATAEKTGDELKLTEKQKNMADRALREYKRRHDVVRGLRETRPDDQELYETLFNKKPSGKVQIIQGPMTLYIRCWDIDDFAYIATDSFRNQSVSEKRMEKARIIRGISLRRGFYSKSINLIPGEIITVENSSLIESEDDSKKIMTHEEQHSIYTLFSKTRYHDLWLGVLRARTKEEILQKMKTYMRGLRERKGDSQARDEILAYFKEKRVSPERVLELLIEPKSERGIYDFLAAEKKEFSDHLDTSEFKNLAISVGIDDTEIESILEQLPREVYDNEYAALLKKCIEIPLAMEKAGYSDDEVIALLEQEPLQRWEKVVNRLLEMRPEKKNRLEKAAGEAG